MRRALFLLLPLLALPSAPAWAKQVTKAQVCGTNQCVDVTDQTGPAVVEVDSMAPPPPPGAAYVRLRVTISGEGAHTTMTQRFVPAAGVLRNDDGAWLRLSPHTTAALRKAAHQVPPFRAEAAAASTHAPAPPSDGFPWPVVVALALAGVLAAIATRITLRRRAATQP